jgi:hypothetical protein
VEHVVDQRLLLVQRHFPEAEMGIVTHADDHSARGRAALQTSAVIPGRPPISGLPEIGVITFPSRQQPTWVARNP